MRHSIIVFLIDLMITGCSPSPAIPADAFTATAGAAPTLSERVIPTATRVPTLTVAPFPPGRKITFDESGRRNLTGTAYGEGQTAIILANMSIGGQKQWDPFIAAVDKHKFTTFTFDYRNINDPAQDIAFVLGYLKKAGFERAICIGASMGTRACNTIAREPEIVGLALIAGALHHASVAEATYPKLFIAGALDRWAFDIQAGYEQAADPKTLRVFDNNRAHGTDLFQSDDREEFLNLLLDFVNNLANP